MPGSIAHRWETQASSKLTMRQSVVRINLLLWLLTSAVVVYMWLEEVLDLPHLPRFQSTPVNWVDSLMAAVVVFWLGCVVGWRCSRLLNRIRYLESFLASSARCKRVRIKTERRSIEQHLQEFSSLQLSQTICPECAQQQCGYTEQEGSLQEEQP